MIERPSATNPNVMEVVEIDDDDGGGGVDDNEEDQLLNDVDPIGLNIRLRGRQRDEEDPRGELEQDDPLGISPPVTGTTAAAAPSKDVEISVLLRHLEAKAKTMNHPVMLFVAGVAQGAGTSLQNMLLNPSLPMVNTSAKSFKDLLSSSQMPAEMLGALLAKVINENLDLVAEIISEAATKDKESPSPYKKPKVKPEPSRSSLGDDFGAPFDLSKLVESRISADIQSAMSFIDSQSGEVHLAHIGAIPDYADPVPPPNFFGGGAGIDFDPAPRMPLDGGGGNRQPPPNPFSAELRSLMQFSASVGDVARWTWNEMPEHSGMALIKPEVVAVIQAAHEDIKRLSAAHSTIKLWHLMTGPSVKMHFGLMVAGMLNAAPSELQYPGIQRSVRNNGAVTGNKVTPGVISVMRGCALYKEKKTWFKSVRYQESAHWREVTTRLPTSTTTLNILRTTLQVREKELTRQMRVFWNNLSTETKRITADLYDIIFKNTTEQERELKARSIRQTLLDTNPRTAAGSVPTLGRVLMDDGVWLVQFAHGYSSGNVDIGQYKRMDGTENVFQYSRRSIDPILDDPERDETTLLFVINDAISALEKLTKRIEGWQTVSQDHRQMIYNLLRAFTDVRAGMLDVKRATDQLLRDRALLADFTEDSKRELVYQPASERVAPLVDYSRPNYGYATI